MQKNEIIWRNRWLSVRCSDVNDFNIDIKIYKKDSVGDVTMTYDGIDFIWYYADGLYRLHAKELKPIIKSAMEDAQDLSMFDFSNYLADISGLWCKYITFMNEELGQLLSGYMPWPFVIAIIVLLINEIYDEDKYS